MSLETPISNRKSFAERYIQNGGAIDQTGLKETNRKGGWWTSLLAENHQGHVAEAIHDAGNDHRMPSPHPVDTSGEQGR